MSLCENLGNFFFEVLIPPLDFVTDIIVTVNFLTEQQYEYFAFSGNFY